MRSRRRPAWPVIMLISGAIASTGIWTASAGLAKATAASPTPASVAAATSQSTHAASPRTGPPAVPGPRAGRAGLARPQAAGFGLLVGVYCTSRTSCWTAMATPEPAGTGKTSQNILTDVTCISVRSCWAVGIYGRTTGDRAQPGAALEQQEKVGLADLASGQ